MTLRLPNDDGHAFAALAWPHHGYQSDVASADIFTATNCDLIQINYWR